MTDINTIGILSFDKRKSLSLLFVLAFIMAQVPVVFASSESDKLKKVLEKQQPIQEQPWKSAVPDVVGGSNANFPKYDWWQAFQDPNLNVAVEAALENNPDFKATKVQIAKAEASSKIIRSKLLPSLSFNPAYTWEKLGKNQYVFPIQERTFQVMQLPLNAQYELDLFGKNLASYRSAKKGIKVARYQYEAARIQLTGIVVSTYLNVAKWRHLETLAQQQLESSNRLLKHNQGLMELGQATLFDIQNSTQRRDQAQVNVTQYENNRALAENYLMVLMGQSPTNHAAPAVSALETLHYPESVDTGVPSQLITHRPDVAAVEAQLAAAQLDISAARKALLPSILLTGSTGYNAVGLKNLFNWTSLSTYGTAALAQSIYTGGRLRAQIKLARADYEQLLNRYESTLISAFSDAENSLATLRADQVVFRDVTSQTENARQKAASREKHYLAGLEGEPLWLAEEVQRLEYEKQLAQQKTQLLVDYVGVAKAMGGGF